jgi:hypothetical protein
VVFGAALPEELAPGPRLRAVWRDPKWTTEATVYTLEGKPRNFSLRQPRGGPTGHACSAVGVGEVGGVLMLTLQQAGKRQFVNVPVTKIAAANATLYYGAGIEQMLRLPLPESLVPPGDGPHQALFDAFSGTIPDQDEVLVRRCQLEAFDRFALWPG